MSGGSGLNYGHSSLFNTIERELVAPLTGRSEGWPDADCVLADTDADRAAGSREEHAAGTARFCSPPLSLRCK